MSEKPVVVNSSTARNLPDYLEQVKDACLRAGLFTHSNNPSLSFLKQSSIILIKDIANQEKYR